MRIHTPLSILSIIATILIVMNSTVVAAPSTPPSGGYTGGLFSRYFQNIVESAPNAGSCPVGQSIIGFTTNQDSSYGTPICSSVSSAQYWSSIDSGNNIYFTGSNNVGIGIALPTAKLDIVGTIKIADGSEGTGKVLMSDMSGLASWRSFASMEADPSMSGLTLNYIPKSVGATLDDSLIYDNGISIGIGTSAPAIGAKLDVLGKVKVVDGTQGAGKALISDTDGLASWQSIPAELPIGTVMSFNLATCPAGWVVANGTSGTPDLRGEFIRGLDSGRGVDAGRVLASAQGDLIKTHGHDISSPAGHTWGANYGGGTRNTTFSFTPTGVNTSVGYGAEPLHAGNWGWGYSTFQGVETRPRNVALLYCMKIAVAYASVSNPLTWQNISGTSTGSVTLATTGNVGVGTNTPGGKLEVKGILRVEQSGTEYGRLTLPNSTGSNMWNIDNDSGVFRIFRADYATSGYGTNGVVHMAINNSGNVGMGTSSPTSKLHIQDATNMPATPDINSQVPLKISDGTSAILIDTNQIESVGGGLNLNYRPTTQTTTIAVGGGLVGVGTASPVEKLSVEGHISLRNANPTVYMMDTDQRSSAIHTNGNFLYFLTSPVDSRSYATVANSAWPLILNLTNNDASFGGNVWAYGFYYISDKNLKKDIKKIESPLEKILKLNGYTFNWKDSGRADIGVIAQEVEKVFPELVADNKNAKGESYKTVQYGNLVAPIIEAIKELANKFDTQEKLVEKQQSELDTLRSENAELRSRLDVIEARLAQ